VIGFTPGGARVEILALYPVPGSGKWVYTYQILGYTAAGDDLSLFEARETSHAVD
jgi:hypothetical protein